MESVVLSPIFSGHSSNDEILDLAGQRDQHNDDHSE
jgi:hypothetical protein